MHWAQGIEVNKTGVLPTPKKCMAWLGRWSSGGSEEKTALHARLKQRTQGYVGPYMLGFLGQPCFQMSY